MKRVLIAAGIVCVLLFGVGGFVAYRNVSEMYSSMKRATTVPPELKLPRVITGTVGFSKTTWFNASGLGTITDMEPWGEKGFAIAGTDGAELLDKYLTSLKKLTYDKCNMDVIIPQLNQEVFLCRGGNMSGTSLIDGNGHTVWSYKGESLGIGPDDAASGELGPAHLQAVIVGMNGDGGVRLFNPQGKLVWQKPDGNVWHVEIAAANDKSGNVIVHSNAGGQLTLRDADGNVLQRYTPEIYLAWFSLTAWRVEAQRNKLIAATKGVLYILSMDGQTVAKLPAPEVITDTDQAKGMPVHFAKGAPFYVAIVRNTLWSRTLLYIYDSEDHIVYDEILDHDCGALQTVPTTNGTEDLLLGCEGTVMKYSHLIK